MPPRRRRPAPKAGPAPTVRVHAIETLEAWRAALAKAAASRRVLVVQLYQAANYQIAQMRNFYRRMSTDGPLKAAVFTEVEVDTAEDALLDALGVLHGATKLPHYECYVDGQMVESYTGGVPAQVAQMIQRQVAELKASSRSSLLPKLLLAASAVAAAAGGVWWHLHHGSSGGGGGGDVGDLGAELRSLNERIAIAQQRLRNCEKAGKLKGAKAQRRIISQLESQQRVVEQQLRQRDASAPASGGGSGGGGQAARRGRGRRSSDGGSGGSQPGSPRRRKPEQDYFSFNDFEQEQRYPTVLYSDEE